MCVHFDDLIPGLLLAAARHRRRPLLITLFDAWPAAAGGSAICAFPISGREHALGARESNDAFLLSCGAWDAGIVVPFHARATPKHAGGLRAHTMMQLVCGGARAGAQRAFPGVRRWHTRQAHRGGVPRRAVSAAAVSAAAQLPLPRVVRCAAATPRCAALRTGAIRPQQRNKEAASFRRQPAPTAASATTHEAPPPEDAAAPEADAPPACWNLERTILLAGFAFEARARTHAALVLRLHRVVLTRQHTLASCTPAARTVRRRTKTLLQTACARRTRAAASLCTHPPLRRIASLAPCVSRCWALKVCPPDAASPARRTRTACCR